MPEFDPTIAAQVNPPASQSINPLGLANEITSVQKNRLEMQQMQQTLAGKAKAGQIMATAPSLDDGIHALTQDPEVAGFVPDIIATLQSVRNAQVTMQGQQQEQAMTGLNAVIQSLIPAINDPTTFDENVAARLATLSPSARTAVEAAMPKIKASLFDDLPSDPKAAGDAYQQRLAATLVGSGMGADGIRAVTGTLAPQVVTVKGPEGQDVTMQVGGGLTNGSAGVIAEGPTASQVATMTTLGAKAGDISDDMAANAGTLPGSLTRLNNMIGALGDFQAGGGADLRAGAGKVLQAFKNIGLKGITQEMIDGVANGSLSAQQIFNANIKPFVVNELKQSAQGTGRVMRSEVDQFLAMADSTTDPAALLNILNQAKKQLQIGYDESTKWLEFKQKIAKGDSDVVGLSIADFPEWYTMHYSSKNLPQETGGGESLAPVQPEVIQGTGGTPPAAGTKPPLSSFFGQ